MSANRPPPGRHYPLAPRQYDVLEEDEFRRLLADDQFNSPSDWTTISASAPSGTPVHGTGAIWIKTA